MILWISFSILISYCLFLMVIIYGWFRIRDFTYSGSDLIKVSVIIPVRNEQSNIIRILDSLAVQTYPAHCYEIIIMDDNSTDNTVQFVEEYKNAEKVNISIFQMANYGSESGSPKKAAITKGVDLAFGEIILITDADVYIPETWIHSYSGAFLKSGAKFISGPVIIRARDSFYEEMQSVEFAVLVTTGASSLYLGYPNMCNGANLGFRKDAFKKVGGYEGNDRIISGDDEFLLFKMHKFFPDGILFLKSKNVLIQTKPVSNIKDFYHQRRRWSGKWSVHSNKNNKMLAIYVFIVNINFLLIPVFWLLGFVGVYLVFAAFLIKMCLEYFLIRSFYQEYSKQMKMIPFVVTSLLYSIYAITFGILANFGSYNWKGRNYKT